MKMHKFVFNLTLNLREKLFEKEKIAKLQIFLEMIEIRSYLCTIKNVKILIKYVYFWIKKYLQ